MKGLLPLLLYCKKMIQVSNVKEIAVHKVKEMNCFLVDVKVSDTNDIKVTFDRNDGVSLDDCVSLTKYIEEKLDREIEDFSLSVSSPGIYSPFTVPNQSFKNYNSSVDILTKTGQKFTEVLKEYKSESETIITEAKDGQINSFELSEIKKINKSKI